VLARLISLIRRNWISIRVIGTFLTLIVGFYFVLDYGPIVDRFDIGAWLARQAAWMSFAILQGVGSVAGYDIWREGTIMGSGDFEVDVAPACSGAVPTSIYLAAVLAYPVGWRPKLIGSLLGIVAIHLVNLLRVAGLFLIGLYFREIFHETHVYVAQSLVVCFAVALWLFWATRFAGTPATT
jgi:exosortase/archaeosortase family protein